MCELYTMGFFFYAKIKAEREELLMLNDDVLEKIFSNKEARKVPIGYQATMVSVFDEVLEQIKGENPYADFSAILSDKPEL